jgi:methionyl-tRNA formyltransferase
MNFIFASSDALAWPIAKNISKLQGFQGFLSKPDKASGRDLKIRPNSFTQICLENGFEVYRPENLVEIENFLKAKNIDTIVTCAYGVLIKEPLLSLLKSGWLNIHFSVLPTYRGAAPVQRAILNGDALSGYSIFKMDAGLDTGPVLFSEAVSIEENEGSAQLLSRLSNMASTKIFDLLENSSSWKFEKQNESGVTVAPKIDKNELQIDWKRPANEVHNQIRGLDFNGGAWTSFRSNRITILAGEKSERALGPGLLEVVENELFVGTVTNALKIVELKPAGGKNMSAKIWLNGARIQAGDKFE